MKNFSGNLSFVIWGILLISFVSCRNNDKPSSELIDAINLKRGDVVLCSPADKQFGTVQFQNSCSDSVKKLFNLGTALLHSFEYDEAEKVYAQIIDKEPGCAMAYWGVAMANYHQVWPSPPTEGELEKGSRAINIAKSLAGKTAEESDYINAIGVFYDNWKQADHRTRSMAFAKAMEQLHKKYPGDGEVTIFYSLSLVGSADPSDKTYASQKKAAEMLTELVSSEPDHPGIVHYIIHSYDYPELAALALPAARKYAAVAPSSAHAQHMPSHIFIRLGLWDESIASNLVSTTAAKCYAEGAGLKGHWDEELHGMDYLVYAYLQKGDNVHAKELFDYLKTIDDVYPANFKVAYAYAAIPARYFLENQMWKEAADMKLIPAGFPWKKFPWQKGIYHFGRLLGAVHTSDPAKAAAELDSLKNIHSILKERKENYMADQVNIQVMAGESWMLFRSGKKMDGLKMMSDAAAMEDRTEKSPVTPGEVIPARELMADMFFEAGNFSEALQAYESNLRTHPNRFNALYGAAQSAEKMGNSVKADYYYGLLLKNIDSTGAQRKELIRARQYIKGLAAK